MKPTAALLLVLAVLLPLLPGCNSGPQRAKHISGITELTATRDGVVLRLAPGLTTGQSSHLDGEVVMLPGEEVVMTNGKSVTMSLVYMGRDGDDYVFSQEVYYPGAGTTVDKGVRRLKVKPYSY